MGISRCLSTCYVRCAETSSGVFWLRPEAIIWYKALVVPWRRTLWIGGEVFLYEGFKWWKEDREIRTGKRISAKKEESKWQRCGSQLDDREWWRKLMYGQGWGSVTERQDRNVLPSRLMSRHATSLGIILLGLDAWHISAACFYASVLRRLT